MHVGHALKGIKMQRTIYIGIGTSAGGLHALEQLVGKLPTNMGYVYIIAQHLDASKKSSLVEILSRFTTIPVLQATELNSLKPTVLHVTC